MSEKQVREYVAAKFEANYCNKKTLVRKYLLRLDGKIRVQLSFLSREFERERDLEGLRVLDRRSRDRDLDRDRLLRPRELDRLRLRERDLDREADLERPLESERERERRSS